VQRFVIVSFLTMVSAIASAVWSAEQTADKSPIAAVHKTIATLEECFNRGDAKGLSALWASDGDFTAPNGDRIAGREKIEAAFREFFAAHKNSKLQLLVVDVRLVTPDVAAVDALSKMTPAPHDVEGEPRSAVLLVLRDGRWLIDSIRETVCVSTSHYGNLKDLAWMAGDWACMVGGSSGVPAHSTCDWTANGSFMIRKFSIGENGGVMGGTEVIGWDPRAHRIRSWVFESDGGFGESEWTHDANHWTIKYKGVLPNGADVSATHVLTHVDADTHTLESTDRMINGQKRPDIAKITIKRQKTAAGEANPKGPAKPPRQVLPQGAGGE
jgi:uncharacterized protein (TIGR02246 family)